MIRTPDHGILHQLAPFTDLGASQPPAYPEAANILYTDGSAATGLEGQSIGAGVYCRAPDLQLAVDPCGISATNTITRAELTAIFAALQQRPAGDCTIATDSLASMFSINRALRRPASCTESPHQALLLQISQLMLSRSQHGLRTNIIKVKAHVGIQGNEEADRLANIARDPTRCHMRIEAGNTAFGDRLWPSLLKSRKDPDGTEQLLWHTAANLHTSIRDHASAQHAKGLTDPGKYHSYWQPVIPELHPSSFAFWQNPRLPFAAKVNLLKARWGQLWNKNIAYRQNMSYGKGQGKALDARCPLCKEADGISHMLGSCNHAMMKGMYIERHNLAARKILRLILEGSHGNCYMLADVGSEAKLGGLGALDSRLPEWLLPDNALSDTGADRAQLRPDILFTNAQYAEPEPAGASKDHAALDEHSCTGKTVWIIEVGYCAATRYQDKLTEKKQQHQRLIDILQRTGYEVHLLPVLLGNTGEIFKSTLANIKLAGADADRVDRLASKLSFHAQKTMQSIVQARRVLEATCDQHTQFTFQPP